MQSRRCIAGYDRASQFCLSRPNFKPILWGGNKTFCDVPPDTRLSPCGLNALWIAYDEYRLSYLPDEAVLAQRANRVRKQSLFPSPLEVASENTVELFRETPQATILTRHRKQLEAQQNPLLTPIDTSQEQIAGEKGSTTSLTVGVGMLNDLAGADPNILEKDRMNLYNSTSSTTMTSSSASKERETKNTNDENSEKEDCQLLNQFSHQWTDTRLKELASKITETGNDADADFEVKSLRKLLNISRRRNDSSQGFDNLPLEFNKTSDGMKKLKSLLSACQTKEIRPHTQTAASKLGGGVDGKSLPFRKLISIQSSPDDLLDTYQQRFVYPRETAIISRHEKDNNAVPWLVMEIQNP